MPRTQQRQGRGRVIAAAGLLASQLATSAAYADERWTYVADFPASSSWPSGKISVDLSSVRTRGRHIEVWERVAFEPQPHPGTTALHAWPESRTLWAIRCRRGTIALVTTSATRAFPPREERLQFQTPAPGSPADAVIGAVCGAAGTADASAAVAPQVAERSDDPAQVRRRLETPPSLVDPDADED